MTSYTPNPTGTNPAILRAALKPEQARQIIDLVDGSHWFPRGASHEEKAQAVAERTSALDYFTQRLLMEYLNAQALIETIQAISTEADDA